MQEGASAPRKRVNHGVRPSAGGRKNQSSQIYCNNTATVGPLILHTKAASARESLGVPLVHTAAKPRLVRTPHGPTR